jgi:hypothetical protein
MRSTLRGEDADVRRGIAQQDPVTRHDRARVHPVRGSDRIATITLNRPEAANAQTLERL